MFSRGAQRLSASRIISGELDPGQRAVRIEPVLNAFRHHGLYRERVGRDTADRDTVCSTPFGITDYIGLLVGGNERLIDDVCSTPFGITDYIGTNWRKLAIPRL